MKFTNFMIKNVVVLNLRDYSADFTVNFVNPVPVIYGFNRDLAIGKAYLMVHGTDIVADILVQSPLSDVEEAEKLIKAMYPSTDISIDSRRKVVTVQGISVSSERNKETQWFGNRVKRIRKRIK